MNADRLVQRVFFGLTILFIIFIVYASWTPGYEGLSGERKSFSSIKSISDVYEGHDLRDITTNVLLYIPLGVFLALALSRRRPKFLSPWLLIGTLVSAGMEIGQSFIGRFPDIVDIVTNSMGYVIGYWVVVASVQFYGLDPAVFLGFGAEEEQDTRTQSIAAFRFIYICIYVLIALLPFDVSVSLEKVYAQLFPDDLGKVRIILDPLYDLRNWEESGLKLTLELLGLLPIAVLTAFLNGIRGRLSALSTIYTCVAVALVSELAQVFILSRTTDIFMIPLAVAAGLLGWGFVKMWFNLQHAEATGAGAGESEATNWRPLVVALIGYAFVIAFFAWSPYQFELDPKTVAKKVIYETNVIPFKQHFSARSLSSATDIVKEAGLFVPFGMLVSYLLLLLLPAWSRGKNVLLSGVISGAFACFTELSQAVCIGRYIDATDILLAGFGGLCGAVVLGLFRFGGPSRRAAGHEH